MARPKLPQAPNSTPAQTKKAAKSHNVKKKKGTKVSKAQAYDKEKVIESMKPFLHLGYSIKKTCKFVGIPYTTVHTWIREDPSIRILLYSQQQMAVLKSRSNIVQSIQDGSVQDSWMWLKAKDADLRPEEVIRESDEWEDQDGGGEEDAGEIRDLTRLLKENGLI